MKLKKLVLIILIFVFQIPINVFSGEWTPMVSGTTYRLYGIWGSSPTDIFAVGENGTILHYDGTTWSPMNSGTTAYLYGVWGSSGTDIFAVGSAGKILHYDGATWSYMTNVTTSPLYRVWGNSGTGVFAVGGRYPECLWPDGKYINGTTEILYYNGTHWSMEEFYEFYEYPLYGMWGNSGTKVFAVGGGGWATCSGSRCFRYCFGDVDVTLDQEIYYYDGLGWSPMTNGSENPLYGVWGSSGTDVFAVGHNGTILHYDGTAWSLMNSGITDILLGVWGSSGNDVFAVGYDANTPEFSSIILHYDGTSWSSMGSPATTVLYDIWGSSGIDVFAVGDDGTILHYIGESECTTWNDVISKYQEYVSGQASWNDVITCYNEYISHQ